MSALIQYLSSPFFNPHASVGGMGKIVLDLTRGEKVMNVSARWRCVGNDRLREAPSELGIPSPCFLFDRPVTSILAAESKGRRSGIGRRGLAGSFPRASDKNLYTIQGEGLKGGQLPKKDLPGRFQGSVR